MIKGYGRRRWLLMTVLVSHVILPIWFIVLLATTAQQDSSTWLLVLFAAAGYTAYISLAGAWSWFGIYTQRAVPVLLITTAFITRPQFRAVNDSPQAAELRLISIALGLLFALLTVRAVIGRFTRTQALELIFPLRDGTYMVGQGGSTKTVNRHRRNRSQRYAIDILKLGRFGIRAMGLYPTDLKSYAIFGADVVSPWEGVVTAAVDGFPDVVPPDRDRQNPAGNYVAVEAQGATIYLAHLMNGSIKVDAGRRVRAGQILGRVGNSGDTSEPHLHVHAEQGGFTGQFSGQPGIPIRFAGRFLVRNDVVDA